MKLQGTTLLGERPSLPRWLVFPVGLLLVIGLGFVDYSAPGRMSFTLLYLVVCMAAGWAAGANSAIALSIIAGFVIGWVEWKTTISNPMPAILLWNTFCRVAVFAGVGWLTAEATRLTQNLHQLIRQRTEQLETEVEQHRDSAAALKEAEERYRSLVSNIPAVVWISDQEGRTTYVSDKVLELLGYEPGEVYAAGANSWFNLIHPEDLPNARAHYAGLFEGRGFDIEYRVQRKDGRWIWVNDRSTSFFTRGGLTHAYGFCVDVTARKQTEEALRQSEQQTNDILATVLDGFLLLDPNLVIQDVNDSFCRMNGFARDELIGMPILALDSAMTREEILAKNRQINTERRSRFESRHRCKSGAEIEVEISASSPPSAKGSTYCFVRDVTARNHAEASLRRSEKRYRSLAEASPDYIFILDGKLQITFANTTLANALSKSSEALIGQPQEAVFGPEITRQHILLEQEVRATSHTVTTDFCARAPSGLRWFETRLVPLGGEDAASDYVMGIARDITDRKRHERALQVQRDVAARLSLTSDLESGLNSLLELATTIDGVDSGGIYLADNEAGLVRLCANRGLGVDFVKTVGAYSMESPQGQVVMTGQTMFFDRKMLDEGALPMPRTEGLSALAAIPLRHENQVLGCLNLASHQSDSISEESRSLLELMGAQAAGAIARIRAEQALKASEERLRTLITGAPVVLFAVDKGGTILFHDGQALKAVGWKGGEQVGKNVWELFQHNPGVLSCVHRALRGEEFSAIEVVGDATFQTWYTPTREASGAVSGYVGVATNITERQRLERQLLEISDREQARIGQEIHDGLCQQLVSLAFDANILESKLGGKSRPESAATRRLAKHLDLSITEARRLARGLFPIRLEAEGISPAIEELLLNTGDRFGLSCQFKVDPLRIANATVATNLYRIAQEALNNVVKHSRAKSVLLEFQRNDDHIELRIQDDGIGMPPEGTQSSSGMGLHIMDYRARIIGGSLRIETRAGGGTVISCLVPNAQAV